MAKGGWRSKSARTLGFHVKLRLIQFRLSGSTERAVMHVKFNDLWSICYETFSSKCILSLANSEAKQRSFSWNLPCRTFRKQGSKILDRRSSQLVYARSRAFHNNALSCTRSPSSIVQVIWENIIWRMRWPMDANFRTIEPVNGAAPRVSVAAMIMVLNFRVNAELALLCQAQANPVPIFRYSLFVERFSVSYFF